MSIIPKVYGVPARAGISLAEDPGTRTSRDSVVFGRRLSSIYDPEEMQRYLDRLYRFALWLARRHRIIIERVAASLETKPALTADEVDALVEG